MAGKENFGAMDKLMVYAIEHRLLQMMIKKINKLLLSIAEPIDRSISNVVRKRLSKKTEIQKNKVVFMSYNNDYICNPKYIYEEILRQELPLDVVWATTAKKMSQKENYPQSLRLVRRGSFRFYQEAASAKVWVDNAVNFCLDPIEKKQDQYYLQTWHGSMGLKRIGKDDVKEKRWVKAAAKQNIWVDVCISNSSFESGVFRETHWPDVPILEYGHARNDIFFQSEEEKARIAKKVREYFYLEEDTKLVLYAPTFRNDTDNNPYDLDYTRLLDLCEELYGGKWALLNRFHFKTKNSDGGVADRRVRQATDYPDMQELMLAVDLGITDYSSWICDFVLSRKPAFIYATDIDSYNKERGFYYPLESTPFPIAKNDDELEERIRNFDLPSYEKKCDEFLEARGCKEEGQAAKRIVELIKEQCLS